ncbi:glycosyltransferase family 4 protein [Chroococcidiopsidales cyanobacterium LEGE 13417]|nr:glycosyltransferase family 4 protein [Chroococcidiopsidales cyanobacterium LEGE 13417]
MTKLLIIFPSVERGGAEEYALTIARDAQQQGWQVHVAFPKTPQTTSLVQDFQKQKISYHYLEIAETYTQKLRTLRQYLPDCLRTLSLFLQIQPDAVIVVLPWVNRSLGTIFACAYLNVPTVVVFQLVPCQITLSQWQLTLYNWSRVRNQQWVAVSQYSQKLVGKIFQIPVSEVKCIYNGTKLEMDKKQSLQEIVALRDRLRQELELPLTSRLVLTVGRLNQQKGYSDPIPIIPALAKEFPEVKFIWVGDGELRSQLEAEVKATKIEASVLFLGYRTDIPQLLKAADLFLFPSHYEGYPFALLEAMAYGLPIVTSNANPMPEIITDRLDGLLFRKGDRHDLLAKLRWALQNSLLMRGMAENAKLRVREFSATKMSRETLDLVWQLMSRNEDIEKQKQTVL